MILVCHRPYYFSERKIHQAYFETRLKVSAKLVEAYFCNHVGAIGNNVRIFFG
jgi:hypothetical protein